MDSASTALPAHAPARSSPSTTSASACSGEPCTPSASAASRWPAETQRCSAAYIRPASIGPSARAALYAALMVTMACGRRSRGRISPTIEFHAGVMSAVQQPATKVSPSRLAEPAQPASSSPTSSATASACTDSAASIRRRRSVVSASTPAGSESTNIGRNTAVCTSAARNDDPVRSTVSHAAAVRCIALAMK
jgi:hypothetical protein